MESLWVLLHCSVQVRFNIDWATQSCTPSTPKNSITCQQLWERPAGWWGRCLAQRNSMLCPHAVRQTCKVTVSITFRPPGAPACILVQYSLRLPHYVTATAWHVNIKTGTENLYDRNSCTKQRLSEKKIPEKYSKDCTFQHKKRCKRGTKTRGYRCEGRGPYSGEYETATF